MSAGQITQGRRIYPGDDGKLHFTQPGDYGLIEGKGWHCRLPNWTDAVLNKWTGTEGPKELCVGLPHHITEHEDGTITASPSVLWGPDFSSEPSMAWHGYLEHGVWREV